MTMEYRKLGHSDLLVSRIGFGAMSLQPDLHPEKLVLSALAAGINFFDTANIYQHGENEIILGKALRGRRKEVILASKVGNVWKEDGSGLDWNPRKTHILESIDATLQRLQTDYLDLYQLHGGTMEDPIDETIDAFETLVAAGKIRYYGISSIRPAVIAAWIKRSNMTSVMMQYSLLDRRPEESCLAALEAAGVGVIARGTVAGGLLAGKASRTYLEQAPATVEKAASLLRSLAGDEPASAVAISFALQQPANTTALVGMRMPEHLEEALQALTFRFPGTTLEEIRAAIPAKHYGSPPARI